MRLLLLTNSLKLSSTILVLPAVVAGGEEEGVRHEVEEGEAGEGNKGWLAAAAATHCWPVLPSSRLPQATPRPTRAGAHHAAVLLLVLPRL